MTTNNGVSNYIFYFSPGTKEPLAKQERKIDCPIYNITYVEVAWCGEKRSFQNMYVQISVGWDYCLSLYLYHGFM